MECSSSQTGRTRRLITPRRIARGIDTDVVLQPRPRETDSRGRGFSLDAKNPGRRFRGGASGALSRRVFGLALSLHRGPYGDGADSVSDALGDLDAADAAEAG